jgi:cytochrome c
MRYSIGASGFRLAVLTAAAVTVTLLGASPSHADGDAAKGKKVFAKCMACHTLEAGKNKVGPSLHGIIGRKSGSIADFTYSDAMKNANLTWDEATLDVYLTNPKKEVPGNKMAFPGLPKAEDRQNLIAYLKEASQ